MTGPTTPAVTAEAVAQAIADAVHGLLLDVGPDDTEYKFDTTTHGTTVHGTATPATGGELTWTAEFTLGAVPGRLRA